MAETPQQRVRSRIRLAEAQNWKCGYCGCEMDLVPHLPTSATTDHFIPIALGGSNEWDNKLSCCYSCNLTRGVLGARAFYRFRRNWMRRGLWPPGCYLTPDQFERFRLIFAETNRRKYVEAKDIQTAQKARRLRRRSGVPPSAA